MAENNKIEVSFTATTKEGSWVTFEENGQPEGITVVSEHILKSVKSVNGIKIKCLPNPNYTKRNDVITFKQDETNDTKETIVTQSGKACDCDAYSVVFKDQYDIIPYYSKQYVIGTISGNAACSLSGISFSCSIREAGVEIVNNDIRLEVGENTSEQSRTFTITYKFKNSQCEGTKTITQQGKGAVVCNCSDLKITCNTSSSYSIPYSGTGNNYITAATYNYTGDCELGNIVVVGYSETAGNITATTGNNNTILLKVGQNPSSSLRYVSFNFSYTLNNVECTYQNNCNIEQKGQTIIPCGCNDVAVTWVGSIETISYTGASNIQVGTYSLNKQQCSLSNVNVTSTNPNVTAITGTNNTILLSVGENSGDERTLTTTINFSYSINGTGCTSTKTYYIQQQASPTPPPPPPVIDCCTAITISNKNENIIPNTGITYSTAYKAFDFSFNETENCTIDKLEFEVSGAVANLVTSGASKVFTSIDGYYGMGSPREIKVRVKYDGDYCPDKTVTFTQEGCDCATVRNVEVITVPNVQFHYTFVKIIVPKECKHHFTGETGYTVGIYYAGTNQPYGMYDSLRYDRQGFEIEDDMWQFGVDANFYHDENYEYGDETHEETNLYVKVTFGNDCSEIQKRFHREYFMSSYISIEPLMYEYEDTQFYPYSGITSGVSTVYAPVGYLVSTTSGLSVNSVIEHPEFVSFDVPPTDMVYKYLKTMSETCDSETNPCFYSVEDNIWPVRCRRKQKETPLPDYTPTGDKIYISGDIETFISTNQFFYDYNERLSYDQGIVIAGEGSDLVLGDYVYNWDASGVDTNDPFCSCGRPYGERCQIDYTDPDSELFCTFKDYLLELARKYIVKESGVKKDNYLVLVNNENLDETKKYIYVIYGQGICYKQVKHYQEHIYIGHKYIPKTDSNKQFVNNLKIAIRPLYYPEKSTYYTYANYINVGTEIVSSDDCKTSFKPKGSFSGASSFDNVKYYLYKNNKSGNQWEVIYNVSLPSSINNTIDISKKFATLPFNTYHYKQDCFGKENGQYELNIAAIDSSVTTTFNVRVKHDNVDVTNRIASLTFQLSTLNDTGYTEYTFITEQQNNTNQLTEIEVELPLFSTIIGVAVEIDEDYEVCNGTQESSLFYTNLFINKKFKCITIESTCENDELIISDITECID